METPARGPFGPLDSLFFGVLLGCSFAGVTAHDGCAATRDANLASLLEGGGSRLRLTEGVVLLPLYHVFDLMPRTEVVR